VAEFFGSEVDRIRVGRPWSKSDTIDAQLLDASTDER
jgi:hypothetical protein